MTGKARRPRSIDVPPVPVREVPAELRAELRTAGRTAREFSAPSAEALLRQKVRGAWSQLANMLAVGKGAHGWSVGAESATLNLIEIMLLIGATPIEQVPYDVVHSGLYDAVLDAAGLSCPSGPADVERVRARAAEYMSDQQVTP